MQLGDAIKAIDEKIGELEVQLYEFDTLTAPRVEKDREILRKMRDDKLKMSAMRDKLINRDKLIAEGKEITKNDDVSQEELRAAIPNSFR
jgi:hypothetical protein